jgi:hypothetical protein
MVTDIKKLIDDYVSAVNAHDVNKAGTFWADDGIYENWGQEIVKHGKKELADFLNTSFAELPDIKMEVKSVFQAGDWVGMERVDSGTFAPSHILARHFRYALLRSFNYIKVRLSDSQLLQCRDIYAATRVNASAA